VETVGLGFCFEDLPVGRQFKTIERTVTEADITNFVNCTGMVEVLFTNLEFLARERGTKQRLAPAALVYAFAEACWCSRRCSTRVSPSCIWSSMSRTRFLLATRSMPNARSSKPAAAGAAPTAGWFAPGSGPSSMTARLR
jgi:hypothetical protein